MRRLGALHLAEEDGVGAAGDGVADAALQARERVAQDRVTLGAAADVETCELLAVAAGEAHGELALVLAEDVDHERAALAHRGLGDRRPVETDEQRRRIERHGGHGAGRRPVVGVVVARGDHGHPGGEVPDDVAVPLPVERRPRHGAGPTGRTHGATLPSAERMCLPFCQTE